MYRVEYDGRMLETTSLTDVIAILKGVSVLEVKCVVTHIPPYHDTPVWIKPPMFPL